MTTALKPIRWAELDGKDIAKQFYTRGIERTARAEIRPGCEFCENTIKDGDKYLDINGAKYAHKSCVASNSNGLVTDRKVITNKMREEASAKKSAQRTVSSPAKRGRPPKPVNNENASDVAQTSPAKRGRKPKSQWAKIADKMTDEKVSTTETKAPAKRGRKPKDESLKSEMFSNTKVKSTALTVTKPLLKSGRKPKMQSTKTNTDVLRKEMVARAAKPAAKRGPKPKLKAQSVEVARPTINLSEVREALPGAIVTLTITGTVEAVQRALDKLQN
jgi:hypothetical protein